ncbi:hypothetical protein F4779DRAFT_630724 [Xylariaceae sp. FL0662B]|nr:hypothetical protein F4779DRAFT_630724 [Xylariaceae sp. FL0662B]
MARVFAFGTDPWDPSHRFQTSWLVSPYVLFALRALMSLYAFTTLLFNIGYECARPALGGCKTARASFSFFTVLTYWGLAFYLAFSAAHTLGYARRNRAPLDRWPRPLQALHSLLYTTAVTYPFLVTVVYWAVLFGPDSAWFPTAYQAWSNVSQHALNSFFALLELVLPRTAPPPWIHLLWLIVILALYLALAYLTRATKGFYTYPFLDPGVTGRLVAAYVFGIAVAIVVVFALVHGFVWLRRWLTETKWGMGGRFARATTAAADEEEVVALEMRGRESPAVFVVK